MGITDKFVRVGGLTFWRAGKFYFAAKNEAVRLVVDPKVLALGFFRATAKTLYARRFERVLRVTGEDDVLIGSNLGAEIGFMYAG